MTREDWTTEDIDAACRSSHEAYDRALARHYSCYFAFHPDEAGEQAWSAKSFEAALPQGWGHLSGLIPPVLRHGECLSGKSSQALVLGMLGVPAELEPDLGWLWPALGLQASEDPSPRVSFEFTVEEALLGERPRQTSVDCLIEADDVVVCIEAKLREAGIGGCSCGGRARGRCSTRVLERDAYRQAARKELGLRWPGAGPCGLSTCYQAARNIAVAKALAGDQRRAVFCLLYDDRNPYFKQTGQWPGWPAVLHTRLADSSRVEFSALSWSELTPRLPLDRGARYWARHKHALPVGSMA